MSLRLITWSQPTEVALGPGCTLCSHRKSYGTSDWHDGDLCNRRVSAVLYTCNSCCESVANATHNRDRPLWFLPLIVYIACTITPQVVCAPPFETLIFSIGTMTVSRSLLVALACLAASASAFVSKEAAVKTSVLSAIPPEREIGVQAPVGFWE
jgi:hypothetical protein